LARARRALACCDAILTVMSNFFICITVYHIVLLVEHIHKDDDGTESPQGYRFRRIEIRSLN
jgi:hypothetical protein